MEVSFGELMIVSQLSLVIYQLVKIRDILERSGTTTGGSDDGSKR